MTDNYSEMQEIFEKLLSNEFLSKEDVEEEVSKFKVSYLSLQNKENFLAFIQNFIYKAEQNDIFLEDRINAFKTEIDSFYHRIADNISLYHISGFQDPKDNQVSGNNSEDINDSLEFISSMNKNIFDVEISESEKPTVTKVLEKLSTLQDQKVQNRVEKVQSESKNLQKLIKEENDFLKNKLESLKDQLRQKKKDYLELEKLHVQNNQSNFDIQQNKVNGYDKQIRGLKNNLEKKNRDILAKDKILKEQQLTLMKNKTKLINIENELQIYKKKDKSINLSQFGKVRFLNNTLNRIIFKIKTTMFNKLLKRKERIKRALINVTDRMKARILMETRKLHCGRDMRSSFLNWMIKSQPDLLRQIFTKIGITAKLSHQIAIWRMKKLVFQPIRKKLPEAVKNIRRMKGFFIMSEFLKNKKFIYSKSFLNSMNPYHGTSKEDKLRNLLMFKLPLKIRKYNYKKAFDILRKNNQIQKRAIEKLILNNSLKVQKIFDKFNQLNKNLKNSQNLFQLTNLISKMLLLKKAGVLKRLRQRRDIVHKFLNRMSNQQLMKLKQALNNLRRNKIQSGIDDLIRREKVQMMVNKLNDQRLNQFNKLRNLILRQKNKEENQRQKINNVLKTLVKQKTEKPYRQAYYKLLENKNSANFRNLRLNNLFNSLEKNQEIKSMQVLNNLFNQSKEERFKEKSKNGKIRNLFSKLNNASNQKGVNSLNQLLKNRNFLKNRENKTKNKLKNLLVNSQSQKMSKCFNSFLDLMRQKRIRELDTKNKNALMMLLKQFQKRRQGQVLQKLKENSGSAKELENKKKNLLRRLIQSQEQKSNKILQKLFNQNKNREIKQNFEDYQKKKQISNLIFKNSTLLKDSFIKLRNFIRNKNNQTQFKILKTRMLLNRLLSKQNQKQQNSLQKLLKRKNQEDKNQKNKEIKINRFFKNLESPQSFKLQDAFQNLKNNNKNQKDKLGDILKRLQRSSRIKCFNSLFSLLKNKQEDNIQEMQDNAQKKFLLSKFKNFQDNLRYYFQKLKEYNNKQKENNNKIFNLLKNNQNQKLFKTLIKLKEKKENEKNQEIIRENNEKLSDEKEGLQREKTLQQLFQAQEQKQLHCLRYLLSDAYRKKIKNLKIMNNMRRKFDKLIGYLHQKKYRTLQQLILNKDLMNQMIEEKEAVIEKKKNLLGQSTNLQEKDKFIKFIQKLKNLDQDSASSNRFADIIMFMKKNRNSTPKYNQIIKKIESGEISNLDELLDYINRNNKNGDLDELITFIDKDFNDKQKDKILLYMKLNNDNGRFSTLIQKMKLNPDLNMKNIMNELQENPETYKELKNLIDGSNDVDKLIDYMKKNNQNGKYSEFLSYLRNLTNPTMDNVFQFLQNKNQNGEYDNLIEFLNNNAQYNEQFNEIIKRLKENNGDGRYDEILRKFPRGGNIIDLQHFVQENNLSGQFDDVLQMIDEDPKDQNLAKKFLENLKKNNEDGKFNEILNKYDNLSNPNLIHIFKYLKQHPTEANKDALQLLNNKINIDKYVRFMRNNNDDGRYNEILSQLKKIKHPTLNSLEDILNKQDIQEPGIQEIYDLINKDFDPEEMLEYASKKNFNGKYNDFLNFFKNKKEKNILEMLRFMKNNNTDGKYNDLIKWILGEEYKKLMKDSILLSLIKNNNAGQYDDLIENLKNKEDIISLLSQILEDDEELLNKNIFGNPEKSKLKIINNYLKHNNVNNQFSPLIKKLKQNPKLSEVISFIKIKKVKGIDYPDLEKVVNDQTKESALDEAIRYMENNNQDGKYTQILNDLYKLEKPTLMDLLHLLHSKKYKNKDFSTLKDVLNKKADKANIKRKIFKFKNYLNQNNDDHKFDGIKNFMEEELLKNGREPSMQELFQFMKENNKGGLFDPLIQKLTDKQFDFAKLKQFLDKEPEKNKDLLAFLNENPDSKISNIYKYIKNNNQDGAFDDVKNYLDDLGLDEDGADDLFKFLANARRRNQFPELFEYLEHNNITDPEEILDYLKKNNHNGKYNDLINKAHTYITKKYNKKLSQEESPTSGPKMNFAYPLKMKMYRCFKNLRNFNRVREKADQKFNSIKEKLLNILKNKSGNQLKRALNKLRKLRENQLKKELQNKRISINTINLLRHMLGDKLRTTLDRLKNLSQLKKQKQQFEDNQQKSALNKIFNNQNGRLIDSFNKLRDHNENINQNQKQMIKKLVKIQNKLLKDTFSTMLNNLNKQKTKDISNTNRKRKFFKNLIKKNNKKTLITFKDLRFNMLKAQNEEELKEAQTKNLFLNFGKSTKSKLREALQNLVAQRKTEKNNDRTKNGSFNLLKNKAQNLIQRYLNLLKQQKLKEDINSEQDELLKKKTLNKLNLNQKGIMKAVIKKLFMNKLQKQDEEVFLRNQMFKLMGRWISNKRKVMNALFNNKDSQIQQDLKKKLAIEKLIHSKKINLKKFLNTLRKNNNEIKTEEQDYSDRLKNLFNSLQAKQEIKAMAVLNNFKSHNETNELKENHRKELIRKYLDNMFKQKKQTLKIYFQNLKDHQAEKELEEIKQRYIHKGFLNILKNKLKKKQLASFLSLKNNSQQIKQNAEDVQKKNEFLKRFMQNYFWANLRLAYYRLINNRAHLKRKSLLVKKQQIRVQRNIFQNYKQILKDTFDKLRNNKQKENLLIEQNNEVKENLFKNLFKKQKQKVLHSLENMLENQRQTKKNEKMNNIVKKKLLNKMKNNQRNNLKSAFKQLRKNKRNQNKNLQKLFNLICKKQSQKQRQGLIKLRENNKQKQIKNQLQNLQLKLTFRDLISKNKDKRRQCLKKLIQNCFKAQSKEEQKNKRLQNVFSKLLRNKVQICLDKLLLNYIESLLKDEKLKRTFDRVKYCNILKRLQSFKNLQNSSQVAKLKEKLKAQLFKTNLSNLFNNRKSQALLKIKQFSRDINDKKTQFINTIRDKQLNEVRKYFNNMKWNNFLYKRNQKSNQLNSLLFCLKKNHKAVKRGAFKHWAKRDFFKNCTNIKDMVEKMMNKRIYGGYEKIKQNYMLIKYRKVIKGLMNLMNLFEKFNDKQKKQCFKQMINQFVANNPWYKKVIRIWSIYANPNSQIAFWRMRFSKNLKKENLSAEQMLRMKKLFYILMKETQKNINHGFWKINTYADIYPQRQFALSSLNPLVKRF